MTAKPKDPLAGFANLQRQITESLRPLAEVHERFRTDLSGLEHAVRTFDEFNERLTRAFAPFAGQFAEFIKRFAAIERQSRLLDQAGFLPHVTTPLHLIEECAGDAARLSDLMERYYRDNWPEIRGMLIARVEGYAVDDEAKQAFREALTAHGHGHYRLVCRGLFPEVERIARIELCDGALQNVTHAAEKPKQATRFLQEIAGELGLSETEPQGYFALGLFRRLTDHLYVRVEDEAQRKRMEADAVPNRHAAVHGLVVYRSFKNSLNTLFMTDYVFQIVNAVKKRMAS
jgi:hypothetical protein